MGHSTEQTSFCGQPTGWSPGTFSPFLGVLVHTLHLKSSTMIVNSMTHIFMHKWYITEVESQPSSLYPSGES